MKLTQLFEMQYPGYGLMVDDDADLTLARDKFPSFDSNIQDSPQRALAYAQAYHKEFYPHTKIIQVDRQNWPDEAHNPIDGKVYAFQGEDGTHPGVYLWVVGVDKEGHPAS